MCRSSAFHGFGVLVKSSFLLFYYLNFTMMGQNTKHYIASLAKMLKICIEKGFFYRDVFTIRIRFNFAYLDFVHNKDRHQLLTRVS